MNTAPRIRTLPEAVQNTQLSAFMKLAARLGWEITAVDDLGVHLRKKRVYGRSYLFMGALTAIFVVGLLIWMVGLIDYIASSDRFLFIPHQDLNGKVALKTADLLL